MKRVVKGNKKGLITLPYQYLIGLYSLKIINSRINCNKTAKYNSIFASIGKYGIGKF